MNRRQTEEMAKLCIDMTKIIFSAIQTQSEIGDAAFDEKRLLQLRNIILAIVQEVKSLQEPKEDRGIGLVED